MGNAITQESRALWLMMRRDGGWWTVRNLVHHWHPTFPEWEVKQLLQGLLAGGFLMQREIAPGQIGYAFTSECKALPGTEAADA